MPGTCPLMSKPDCRQSSFGAHRSGAVTVEAPQHIPFLRPTFFKYVLPSFFINKLSNFVSLSLPAAGDKVLGRGQRGGRKKLWWKKDILWGYRDLGQRSNKRDPLLTQSNQEGCTRICQQVQNTARPMLLPSSHHTSCPSPRHPPNLDCTLEAQEGEV